MPQALILEAHPALAHATARGLQDVGYDVVHASHADALAFVRQHASEVVIVTAESDDVSGLGWLGLVRCEGASLPPLVVLAGDRDVAQAFADTSALSPECDRVPSIVA